MQIKTTVTPLQIYQDAYCRKTAAATSVGKDVQKLQFSYITGENVKWFNCLGKQFGSSSES